MRHYLQFFILLHHSTWLPAHVKPNGYSPCWFKQHRSSAIYFNEARALPCGWAISFSLWGSWEHMACCQLTGYGTLLEAVGGQMLWGRKNMSNCLLCHQVQIQIQLARHPLWSLASPWGWPSLTAILYRSVELKSPILLEDIHYLGIMYCLKISQPVFGNFVQMLLQIFWSLKIKKLCQWCVTHGAFSPWPLRNWTAMVYALKQD